MKNLLVSIFVILFLTQAGWAQSNLNSSTFKRTTATILFASIAGGVLGLSTLSFYGKPQEHTDNITTGVLVGFLAGVGYVSYDNYQQAPPTTFSQIDNSLKSSKNKYPVLVSWQYNW